MIFSPEYYKYSVLYHVIKKIIITTVAGKNSKVSIKSKISISQVLRKPGYDVINIFLKQHT